MHWATAVIAVIARSEATKQSIALHTLMHGLLRFARNDGAGADTQATSASCGIAASTDWLRPLALAA